LREDGVSAGLEWFQSAFPSAAAAETIGRAMHPLGFAEDHSMSHLWIAFPDDQEECVRSAFYALCQTVGLPFVFSDSFSRCGPAAALCHICLVTAVEAVEFAASYERHRRITLVSFSARDALGVEALTLQAKAVPDLGDMERMLQEVLLPALAMVVGAYLQCLSPDDEEADSSAGAAISPFEEESPPCTPSAVPASKATPCLPSGPRQPSRTWQNHRTSSSRGDTTGTVPALLGAPSFTRRAGEQRFGSR
jgi:hypothetical protein